METEKLLLQIEQSFKDHKEISDREIANLKISLEKMEQRLKDVETSKQKTDFQYEQIMETLQKINDKTIPSLITEIEELKNKPVKRYDQIITVAISTIFGAILGFILNIILGGAGK